MFKDLILAVTGGLLGLLFNLLFSNIQRKQNEKGNLYIYFRKVNNPNNNNLKGWGFMDEYLMIPLYVDLQNTTNTNKAVRDFSLYLYFDDKKIKKFVQASMKTNAKNEDVKTYGQVSNRYSFVVGPKSIVTADCLYMLKNSDIGNEHYNRIVACYYDENNKKYEYELVKFEHKKQDNFLFDIDEDWIQLN